MHVEQRAVGVKDECLEFRGHSVCPPHRPASTSRSRCDTRQLIARSSRAFRFVRSCHSRYFARVDLQDVQSIGSLHFPKGLGHVDLRVNPHLARKSMTSLMVAFGFSSMIQCPEFGTMPPVTLVATKRKSSAIAVPKDFSAPTANTGIVILPPWASSALLSMASWLNAPNCSNASCMACGRAYSLA